jgi:hypothetical protein
MTYKESMSEKNATVYSRAKGSSDYIRYLRKQAVEYTNVHSGNY